MGGGVGGDHRVDVNKELGGGGLGCQGRCNREVKFL